MSNEDNEVIETENTEMELETQDDVVEDTSSEIDQDVDQDESQDDDSEDSEPSEETEVEKSQKKNRGVKKRIGKLAKERDEARQKAEYLEKLLLEKEQKRDTKKSEDEKPSVSEMPNEDDFETFEEYIQAKIDYGINQGLKARDEKTQSEKVAQKEAEKAKQWQSNVETFKQDAVDFEDVLEDVSHINISQPLTESITESEYGPQVLYELAKDPDEAERIASLSDYAAIREIGKIEARIQSRVSKNKKVKTSKAPKPISSVRGAAKVKKDPDSMSFSEYEAWREKNNL